MKDQNQGPPHSVPGYDIIQLIGQGGMGEVYLATQRNLGRPVAIKFLTATTTPSGDLDARFRREAELMAKVSHPNVVTIFDFGMVEGRAYLVMEYIEDGDLRSRMVADSPMQIGEIRTIIRPVVRAVEFLNRQGIIHRDIKPENILIHHEQTPKVTDFGIAVLDFAIGTLTRPRHSMGTLGYVAPEQQYGLKVDERADQYSLAAICYEMATGRRPLGVFPPPTRLNPKLGRAAESTIMRALSADPADRFPTIDEFGSALDRGLALACHPAASRIRQVGVAALALLAIVGIVASIYQFVLKKPPPQVAIAKGNQNPETALLPNPAPQVNALKPPPEPKTYLNLTGRSVEMRLVKIPEGEFLMGSTMADPYYSPNESPQHRVRISRPFFLGETEVTVAQFRKFVEAKHYVTTAERKSPDGVSFGGGRYSKKLGRVEHVPGLDWKNPADKGPSLDDHPVVQVSWEDAVKFCEWLTEVEGRPFRLPTEAEWEYACRAGTTTRWSSGDEPTSLDPFAWTVRNPKQTLHPVGTRQPNLFGLFDMHGNASEWCSDYLGDYPDEPVVAPQGPPTGRNRILRGGAFTGGAIGQTRSASRGGIDDNLPYHCYGFRVCSPEVP